VVRRKLWRTMWNIACKCLKCVSGTVVVSGTVSGMLLVFSLLFWEEVEFVNHSSSEVPGTAVAISQKEPTTAQRDHNTAASKIKSAVSRIPTKQRLAFIVDSNGQHSSYFRQLQCQECRSRSTALYHPITIPRKAHGIVGQQGGTRCRLVAEGRWRHYGSLRD